MDIKSRVKDLTLKLVAIPSISETDGENECARFIHGQMARWPYFMEHPQLNQLIPIPHDPLGTVQCGFNCQRWDTVQGYGGIARSYRYCGHR